MYMGAPLAKRARGIEATAYCARCGGLVPQIRAMPVRAFLKLLEFAMELHSGCEEDGAEIAWPFVEAALAPAGDETWGDT